MDEQINKVASVIGASRGIGAAVVEWLTREGFIVVINYSGDAGLERRCFFPCALDVLLERFGFRLEATYRDFNKSPLTGSSPKQICIGSRASAADNYGARPPGSQPRLARHRIAGSWWRLGGVGRVLWVAQLEWEEKAAGSDRVYPVIAEVRL
jgi:NAD(P)-dependent dehydrogenase (short-subunit alcohol dehydrogenase family)